MTRNWRWMKQWAKKRRGNDEGKTKTNSLQNHDVTNHKNKKKTKMNSRRPELPIKAILEQEGKWCQRDRMQIKIDRDWCAIV